MTDNATHTPLPWTAERDLPHNRMPRVHSSVDGSLICECGNMGTTQDQWEANAAFIVHAVNSHHDLIEALRDARTSLSITRTNIMCEIGRCADPSESRWAGVPEQLAKRIAKIDAIITKAEAGHG